MRSLIKALVFGAIVSFSFSAQAGFLLEPFVNQSITGDAKFDGGSDIDATNLLYGARVGYALPMGFMFGADFQLGTGTWSNDAFTSDGEVEYQDMGLFAGYQSAMGFRLYGAFMLQNELSLTNAIGGEIKYSDGTGIKIGAGYAFTAYGAPWFAVNLEYHMFNYDEAEQGGVSATGIGLDTSAIYIGVSLPIDFSMM